MASGRQSSKKSITKSSINKKLSEKNLNSKDKTQRERIRKMIEEAEKLKADLREKYEKKFQKSVKDFSEKEFSELFKYAANQSNSIAKNFAKNVKDSVKAITSSLVAEGKRKIDEYYSLYDQYTGNITTRLLGTEKDYKSVMGVIKKGIGSSGLTSIKTTLENLNKIVERGIVNNIEQRAFLESVSDRIAGSFDVLDSTLVNLARINTRDSSVAYLGMESALTEFLNSSYGNSQYLTDLRDGVSSSLYEATSQLGVKAGAEFEYVVQKWLGSMYSVGVSGGAIDNIAKALGYLGSGNISGILSNSSMNNMMAMAANNSGLSYGDILTGGLNASSVESLLYGIYKQITEISKSGDKVAQSQYAQLFGLSISDLRAIGNIQYKDIDNLLRMNMDYESMLTKTEYELSKVGERTGIVTKLDNIMDNVFGQLFETTASSAGSYLTYKLADLVGNISVPIPMLGVMNLADMIKTGVVGVNVLTNIGTIMGNLFRSGGINLSDFTTSETYGNGYISGVRTGYVSSSTNQVSVVSSTDTDELMRQSMAGTQEQASVISESVPTDTSEQMDRIDTNVAGIFELLKSVVNGDSIIKVAVEQSDSFTDYAGAISDYANS